MSENMTIYEKVRAVPSEALKAIGGGRLKGMSDINPMWRIKMLTEVFGICGIGWKIEVTDKRLENGSANEIVCFVDILLYVKVENEWSAPIPGMGGSSFVTMEKSGPYTSDECFKMAYTDAISVACKSLGFAADVYYANDRTKYTNQEDENKPQHTSTGTSQQTQTNTQNNTTGQTGASTDCISEGQTKMLYAKWKSSKHKELAKPDVLELISAELVKTVGDFKDIGKSDINKVIKWFENAA
jgi:hypothetical protein